MTTKVCSKCKVEKGRDAFYKNRTKYDGLQSVCMKCIKGINANYYANNPEKVKARAAKWHANNPEKVRAIAAKWYANNQEKAKARSARYKRSFQYHYIKQLLGTDNPPQELIELKRIQLRIHREIYKKGEAES